MGTQGRHDLTDPTWSPWIAEISAATGVRADLVDVPRIHDLTKHVAHRYTRPMAPVSSYVLGLALGAAQARGADDAALEALADELTAAIVATLPAEQGEA